MIIDNDKIGEKIINSEAFKKHITKLIQKYGNNDENIYINEDNKSEDTLIRFDSGDLLYALHDATMYIKINKNKDDTLRIEGEIIDTYDFNDFKNLKEYADSNETTEKLLSDIFSTTLNNFAVVSSEYGVIKVFDLKIKFKDDNYEL